MLLRGFFIFLVACAVLWGVAHWLCNADGATLKQTATLTFKVLLCIAVVSAVCVLFVSLF